MAKVAPQDLYPEKRANPETGDLLVVNSLGEAGVWLTIAAACEEESDQLQILRELVESLTDESSKAIAEDADYELGLLAETEPYSRWHPSPFRVRDNENIADAFYDHNDKIAPKHIKLGTNGVNYKQRATRRMLGAKITEAAQDFARMTEQNPDEGLRNLLENFDGAPTVTVSEALEKLENKVYTVISESGVASQITLTSHEQKDAQISICLGPAGSDEFNTYLDLTTRKDRAAYQLLLLLLANPGHVINSGNIENIGFLQGEDFGDKLERSIRSQSFKSAKTAVVDILEITDSLQLHRSSTGSTISGLSFGQSVVEARIG